MWFWALRLIVIKSMRPFSDERLSTIRSTHLVRGVSQGYVYLLKGFSRVFRVRIAVRNRLMPCDLIYSDFYFTCLPSTVMIRCRRETRRTTFQLSNLSQPEGMGWDPFHSHSQNWLTMLGEAGFRPPISATTCCLSSTIEYSQSHTYAQVMNDRKLRFNVDRYHLKSKRLEESV